MTRKHRSTHGSPWGPIGLALGLAMVMVGLAMFVSSCYGNPQAQIRKEYGEEGAATFAQKGKPAPDFALLSLEGKTYRLSDFRGQPVVLNFWATWCPPCKAEMPLLDQRAQELKGRAVFLAVNFEETKEQVESFAASFDFQGLLILLDPKGIVGRKYFINALPTTFFIDSNGVIRGVRLGVLTETMLDDYLRQIGLGQ